MRLIVDMKLFYTIASGILPVGQPGSEKIQKPHSVQDARRSRALFLGEKKPLNLGRSSNTEGQSRKSEAAAEGGCTPL